MNVAIVLNYKSPNETIVCVESLLKYCTSIDFIVVVDNDSRDGSVERLCEWKSHKNNKKVTVLINASNSGYAGGNNFGIKWSLKNLSVDNFWIVNNDAYVVDDAFFPILKELKKGDLKFIGSVIVGDKDQKIECYGGGRLYPILGKAKLLAKGKPVDFVNKCQESPDYLMGCSLAFPVAVIDKVGLMDEEYFMYSEEVDWQYRAKKKSISIKVVRESLVYHHGSLSYGGRSEFYYYYRNRAAVRFNKRFYGILFAFTSACFLSLITTLHEYNKPKLVWMGIKGAFKGVLMDV
ncbi:glycosyltransferase family 2 protein [Marinobacterium sp. YM272]|uniref:glycosyltransferase family 2 protein n=1 Tax=Marinobacterium sp. YM272 TaxID=3421654 RepID=UPI003D7F284B